MRGVGQVEGSLVDGRAFSVGVAWVIARGQQAKCLAPLAGHTVKTRDSRQLGSTLTGWSSS